MNEDSRAVLPGGWLTVGLLWGVGCLNYLDRLTITTMHTSLKAAIPMSEAQFGLLTTGFLIVYACASPLTGYLADRFGRTRVVITSLLVWSVVTWLTAYAKSFSMLLGTRAVMGVSEACYQPASNALITDYHPGPTRSTATGINVSGVIIGSALGGFGGLLADAYGWRAPFSIFGLVGIAYGAVLLVRLRDVRGRKAGSAPEVGPAPESIWKAARCLFGNFGFILAVVYWGLGGIVAWSIIGWMPTYMQEHFHLTQGKAGIVSTACTQASAFLGVLVGGLWADRWSLSNPRARMLVTSIGMGLAAPGVILATHASIFVAAMAGLVIFGFLSAFSDANIMPVLCLLVDARYRAMALGFLNCCGCAAGGLAILVGGVLRDSGFDIINIFRVGAGGLLLCALIMFCIKPRRAA